MIDENVAVAVAQPGGAPMHSEGFEQVLVAAARTAAVGELAAGVVHEISNPLFAILGLVDLLLGETEPDAEAHHRLEMIRESGAEIREIVRGLSEFAHGHQGAMATTTLERAARDAVDLVRLTSAAKEVEIVERYPAVPALVHGSSSQLEQVFVSLITNAQQAIAHSGTITLEVARDGAWSTAAVADTGPGIAPDVLPYIFDPFFTTRAGEGGTGLGLAASRAIARRHGGDLSVEPSVSGGARLTLRVPTPEARL